MIDTSRRLARPIIVESIKEACKMKRKSVTRIPFPHPGETIREDYRKPLGMSVKRLALELRVPATL